jgi:hypothetical protein
MITEVLKYQTSDGKLHESEQKAKDHDLDRVRSLIDDKLKFMVKDGKMSHSDLIGLILKFLPMYEDVVQLHKDLKKILD